jgi:fructose-specific phosphotransferase system IIC component
MCADSRAAAGRVKDGHARRGRGVDFSIVFFQVFSEGEIEFVARDLPRFLVAAWDGIACAGAVAAASRLGCRRPKGKVSGEAAVKVSISLSFLLRIWYETRGWVRV